MRSRTNGGVIGAFSYPTKNYANGVFFIHDAGIYNTGSNPIWPIYSGYLLDVTTTGDVSIDPNDSNYKFATFTANGSFQVVTGSSQIEMLIVGGGGGGGGAFVNSGGAVEGAGGGGGGAVVIVNQWINPGTTITVTVGTGGTFGHGTISGQYSTSGTRSSAVCPNFAFYALGGGNGAHWNSNIGAINAVNGGSGGGGFGGYYSPSSSIQNSSYGYGYGYNGGSSTYINSYYSAGGGGGAGGAGGPGVNAGWTNGDYNGDGGPGIIWNRTGQYYGPGGAGSFVDVNGIYGTLRYANGGRYYNSSNTSSFYSSLTVPSTPTTYGAGGHGGPARYTNSTNYWGYYGSNGANGVVIIRYRYK